MTVTDDIEITFARRLRLNPIWSEDVLEQTELVCVKEYDSMSQEEFRRFVDMDLIDGEGYITKRFPLPRILYDHTQVLLEIRGF